MAWLLLLFTADGTTPELKVGDDLHQVRELLGIEKSHTVVGDQIQRIWEWPDAEVSVTFKDNKVVGWVFIVGNKIPINIPHKDAKLTTWKSIIDRFFALFRRH